MHDRIFHAINRSQFRLLSNMLYLRLFRSLLFSTRHIRRISIEHRSSGKTLIHIYTYAMSGCLIDDLVVHANSVLILSLVLPSRQETCRFHLNLQTATIGQLMRDIQIEDAGIEHVHVYDENGHLLSKSNRIYSLLQSSFTIELNKQRTFLFDSRHQLQMKTSSMNDQTQVDRLSTENTVAILHHALNMMNMYHRKHRQLQDEANELTAQLKPLEKVREYNKKRNLSPIDSRLFLSMCSMHASNILATDEHCS
jgi:hypothetical protein